MFINEKNLKFTFPQQYSLSETKHVLIRIVWGCCSVQICERWLVLWCHCSVGVWAGLFILFSVSYVGECHSVTGPVL